MWGELSSEWGELSSECGEGCHGASFLWGELSWGELSLGRVVRNPSRNCFHKIHVRKLQLDNLERSGKMIVHKG